MEQKTNEKYFPDGNRIWDFTCERTWQARREPGDSGGGQVLTGKWSVKADFYGTPLYFQMELNEKSGKLSGIRRRQAGRDRYGEFRSILWRKTTRAGRRSARP